MNESFRPPLVPSLALGLLSLVTPLCPAVAQEKATVPPGGAVQVTIAPWTAPAPPVTITLHERHGHVTPVKDKCAHTGGGLIDVASPSPDTAIVSMTGASVGNAALQFDLEQCFEVSFDNPKVKWAHLTVEGRVIGLLRGERHGSSEYDAACATVVAGPAEVLTVCVPPHSVGPCDSLAVNDHDGPKTVPVTPGKYTLHQTFHLASHSDLCLCKRPSAEFAPDPALDPLWINYWEPFHGVKKDSFGFQVTIKVAEDTSPPIPPPPGGGGAEPVPVPKPDTKPGV
jgi:hypothetical protein